MTAKRRPHPLGAEFSSLNGQRISGSHAVFPMCTSTFADKGPIQFIGTAFFIGHLGLFATARHNLMNAGKPLEILFSFHFLPGNRYLLRNVWKWVIHPTADIAVGMLTPAERKGKQLTNRALTLSPFEVKTGDVVATFAVPKTEIETQTNRQIVRVDPTWHFGHIEQVYPTGRDRVFYPGPTYQTTIELIGGSSGGPVFDRHGMVIGVNSTGYDVALGQENISFVTPIFEALDFRFPFLNVPALNCSNPSLRDLVECGQVFMGRGQPK